MTNDEVQEIIDRAEDKYDMLKDRVHDLYDENKVLKKEIERLNNIIEEIDEFISYKIIIEANAKGYQITFKDLIDIKKELLKLKGDDKE